MAKLLFTEHKLTVHPKNYHKMGRNSGAVDTYINLPEVSRLHCILKWENEQWSIRDVSTNGIWLNGSMMPKKSETQISIGDEITLAGRADTRFVVLDVSAPADYLSNQDGDVIYLDDYNLLPNDSSPEVAFYYNYDRDNWLCEYINEEVGLAISNEEKIQFSDCFWQLHRCKLSEEEATTPIDHDQFEYVFRISQDEEDASVELHTGNAQFTLPTQAHNYLTVLLARYKLQQLVSESGDITNLGWVTSKQLQKDLGLSESHLNIQVHRARKQFAALNKNNIQAEDLIERKRGQLRFSGSRFMIYKGGVLEGSSLEYIP